MGLSLFSAPAVRAVLLEELKDHLKVDAEDDIAYIAMLIDAIMARVDGKEGILNRALITQTWDFTLDAFPHRDFIQIPLPPLQTVTSITYIDGAGDTQTWAASNYTVITDRLPGRVVLGFQLVYPDTQRVPNAVTVRYVAGYGDSWNDVPATLRLALMQLAAHWYENRDPILIGTTQAELPMHVQALLMQHRHSVVV